MRPAPSVVLLCLLTLAAPALAQEAEGQAAFDAANKYLAEQSNSRACEQFNAFLKANPSSSLAREAKVKRARACLAVGRDGDRSLTDLRATADDDTADFARALANLTLSERGENWSKKDNRGRGAAALDQLAAVAKSSSGRVAKESRAHFFRIALNQLQQSSYDVRRSDSLTEQILRMEPSANDRAHALFLRGQTYLQQGGELSKKGEKELTEVGRGGTEWADDAMYALGLHRMNYSNYVAALEAFEDVTKKFNGTTSNVYDNAKAQIEQIKRPSLSANFNYFEVAGGRPELSISFRNVTKAQVVLKKLDPLKIPAERGGGNASVESLGEFAATVRSWQVQLKEPSRYAPGSSITTVEVPSEGAYLVEVSSEGLSSAAWTLVSAHAAALKVSKERVAAFVSNSLTGQAAAGAKAVFFVEQYDQNGYDRWLRYDATTDENGVAVVDLKEGKSIRNAMLWTVSGASVAYARGYGTGYYDSRKEFLAYVFTDRPLYKPGEKVGAKVFLRTRADGPSTPVANRAVKVRVYDAQSRELKAFDLQTNDYGTAHFELQLGKDATLGQYRFYVQADQSSYSQPQSTFRVEEFKPPEFTVKVEPVGAPEPGKQIKMRVTASRYSGGPVANAQGRAIVTERVYTHSWAPWEDDVQVGWWSWYGGYGDDYGDDDEGYRYKHGRHYGYQPAYKQHTLSFKTNAEGVAEVEIPAPADTGDRSYLAQVFVTDATRREVSGQGTINVSRTPYFVDLRSDRYLYKPGERINVKLRSEDANGRPMNPAVEVRLLRIEKDGTTAQILKRETTLTGGRGTVALDGDAIGAVRIMVRKAGATDQDPVLASTDVWLTSDVKPMAPPNAGFNLYTDRAPLKAGGTLRALLVTPQAGGHAFITVEGLSLFYAKGVAMNGQARFIEIPLTGQMTPNAWLHVVRFEGTYSHQRAAVMKVSGSDTAIDVQVTHTSELIEPGAKQSANVTLKNFSAETELTVTSVDEAIFAIEPMRKDFLSWFGRRPQQQYVTTSVTQNARTIRRPVEKQQAEPMVAQNEKKPSEAPADMDDREREAPKRLAKEEDSFGEKAASAPAAESRAEGKMSKKDMAGSGMGAKAKGGPSGGAEEAEEPVKVRSNFSSSAGWNPRLRAQGRAEVPLTVPDSLTRFKTVVLAVSKGPHMGIGEASYRTEKPLMVRLEAPRFFTERDEVTLSALVSNRTTQPISTAVSFAVGANLKALDPTQKTVNVPASSDVRVDVRYLVVEPGEVALQVTARGGGKADAVAIKLNAVVHGAAQRVAFSGRLTDTMTVKVNVPALRNPKATRFELTLSPSLISVMMDSLPYLASFPYGCVEQTLSRFVPAVIAQRAVKDLGLPKTRIPPDLDAMIAAGLERLYGFQHGDGGWGWWQADATNRWMTAYVVYGLSLAKDAGVAVRPGVIERGREWLIAHAGAAGTEDQAFMVFALANTGSVPKAVMDKAFARRGQMSKRAKAMLANALVRSGDSRARIGIENLDDILVAAKERGDISAGDANDQWSTSEAIETTAYTLMAISRYDLNSPHVKSLTDFLVLRRNGGKWRTTRDTAFAVYALAELAAREKARFASGTFIVEVNGREVKRLKFTNAGMDLVPIVLDDAAFKPGENTVTLKRDGGGTGYYAALFDVYNRDENVKGVGGDLKVTRKYTILGKPSANAQRITADAEYGMPVESGVRVRVDLEVKANKAMEYIMIEDLKAAGFEAVAQKSGPELCNYSCAHVELRTDRVAFFITNLPVGVTRYSYELRAEVPGRFHALPARGEAMYAPEMRSTSDEMRFDVRDAPEAIDVGVSTNKSE